MRSFETTCLKAAVDCNVLSQDLNEQQKPKTASPHLVLDPWNSEWICPRWPEGSGCFYNIQDDQRCVEAENI